MNPWVAALSTAMMVVVIGWTVVDLLEVCSD